MEIVTLAIILAVAIVLGIIVLPSFTVVRTKAAAGFAAVTIFLGIAAVVPANSASHLPNCKTDSNCLIKLGSAWESVTAAEIQTMIDSGADVNAMNDDGLTPLHLAVIHRNAEIVSILIKAYAYPSPGDSNGATPLDISVNKGFSEITSLLQSAGGITAYDKQQARKRTKKENFERKQLSDDGSVFYKFLYKPICESRFRCIVIEATAIEGCPRSLYVSVILFDNAGRNIGWTNDVTHGLQRGEKALLNFPIIEKNVASYRVGEISCR